MNRFKTFLTEAKNIHMEHLEDEILNHGPAGVKSAIYFLESLLAMLSSSNASPMNITTKWDGAPAIIAGIDPENGKFFVGTKGVFNKTPKVNYTAADVDKNHDGPLAKKLKTALKYFPALGIKTVLQGDMMFAEGDLSSDKIDGETYTTFQPNTITYAVPKGSAEEKKIKAAKIGIVWHTEYTGDKLSEMSASYNVNASSLTATKNVWFDDAKFKDVSGTATFTKSEADEVAKKIKVMKSTYGGTKRISKEISEGIQRKEKRYLEIKSYTNVIVKAGETIKDGKLHVQGYYDWAMKKHNDHITAAKKEATKQSRTLDQKDYKKWYNSKKGQLYKLFDLYKEITDAKLLVLAKLKSVKRMGTFLKTNNGFKVTDQEGFVAIDSSGTAVKLVDRLEFSKANFTTDKNWM